MTRRLAIAIVAFVALIMAGVSAEMQRRTHYQDRINYHLQNCAETPGSMFHELPPTTQDHLIASAKHHAAMLAKYQTALLVPLFFVPPDPPEP